MDFFVWGKWANNLPLSSVSIACW